MSTFVQGELARSVGPDSFRDITELEAVSFVGGITFDGDLTPEQVDAVRERMSSTDDADQAERAKIRDAAAAGACNLAVMLAARILGDPVPDAVFPVAEESPTDPNVPPPAS